MFEGKNAIVTGASRGIGRAIALALGSRGCHVAFTYRQDLAAAESLERELKELGVRAWHARVDMADHQALVDVVKRFKDKLGDRIDYLVNNAGMRADRALFMMDEETWDRVIDVNLKGTYSVTRSVVFPMMKRKQGVILNISSISGLMGTEGQANYAASKAGVIALTKSLAREVGKVGVRVNALALGLVETDMTASLPDLARRRLLSLIPLGRMATVAEASHAALYLLGDDSAYLTGQVLVMDGGLT